MVSDGLKFFNYAFSEGNQGNFLNVTIESERLLQKFIVDGVLHDYLKGLLTKYCLNGMNNLISGQDILSDVFINKDAKRVLTDNEVAVFKMQINTLEKYGWKLNSCNIELKSRK